MLAHRHGDETGSGEDSLRSGADLLDFGNKSVIMCGPALFEFGGECLELQVERRRLRLIANHLHVGQPSAIGADDPRAGELVVAAVCL